MNALHGKPRSTRHVCFRCQSTYAWHTLHVDSPHTWQPFMSHRQIWMNLTAPEKKGSRYNPQHVGWLICGSVTSFSPKPTNKAIDLIQAYVDDKLLGLLGPYHQHAIGTFNTCLWGSTQLSLTDTGMGYNLAGAGLPTSLYNLPNRWSYTFHLMASSSLRLSIQTLPIELRSEQTLNLTSGTSPLDF
jgi:hypothetical protein